MEEKVILVDRNDREIGTMGKLRAHQEGALHRAISIFIFNTNGELLLQQRAAEKYHSPLLWTNTCCTHPRKGELLKDAALRRLEEEMGMSCALTWKYSFIYRVEMENGLTENELDHVFFGISDTAPVQNPAEVAGWKYMSMENVKLAIAGSPEQYTAWFKIMLDKIKQIRDEHID